MEQTKTKRHYYFLKFIIFLIISAGIMLYASSFPSTMALFDKHINKIIEAAGREEKCTLFSDFSEFADKTVNKVIYFAEIVEENIAGTFENTKSISGIVLSQNTNFLTDKNIITSGYGKRKDPISNKESTHRGIDVSMPEGTEVFPAWPGKIIETGYDDIYGNYIKIEHSRDFSTKYCHLSEIKVLENDFVNVDSIIGKAGSTGRSTGSHLHFEVEIEGRNIDPMDCIDI